jgi:hypothetical protein
MVVGQETGPGERHGTRMVVFKASRSPPITVLSLTPNQGGTLHRAWAGQVLTSTMETGTAGMHSCLMC